MWHVSSRSGVATLRTAIHLLLTYLLTYFTRRPITVAVILSTFPRTRLSKSGLIVWCLAVASPGFGVIPDRLADESFMVTRYTTNLLSAYFTYFTSIL